MLGFLEISVFNPWIKSSLHYLTHERFDPTSGITHLVQTSKCSRFQIEAIWIISAVSLFVGKVAEVKVN